MINWDYDFHIKGGEGIFFFEGWVGREGGIRRVEYLAKKLSG